MKLFGESDIRDKTPPLQKIFVPICLQIQNFNVSYTLPMVLRDIRDKNPPLQKILVPILYSIINFKLAIRHLIVSKRIFKCNIFKIFSEGELPGPPIQFHSQAPEPPIVNPGLR